MARRSGFTLVEVVALGGALTLGGAIVGVLGQPPAATTPPDAPAPVAPASTEKDGASAPNMVAALVKARSSARQLKCATQVRGTSQALIVWASNNAGKYPLPSELDAANQTVADVGRAKDTTANIFSIMIFNGMVSPEICICPDEQSKKVSAQKQYEYSSPAKAVRRADALWDPAFGADFLGGAGNVSYAHLQPSGDMVESRRKDKDGKPILVPTGRLKMWTDTYASTEAIVGDRSPEIESVAFEKPDDAASAKVKTKIASSNTLKAHGAPTSWEGNVGYNDNHVDFITTLGPTPKPTLHTYTDKLGKPLWDSIYFDEADDAKAENTFMGIFVKAGTKPAEFKGIWD